MLRKLKHIGRGIEKVGRLVTHDEGNVPRTSASVTNGAKRKTSTHGKDTAICTDATEGHDMVERRLSQRDEADVSHNTPHSMLSSIALHESCEQMGGDDESPVQLVASADGVPVHSGTPEIPATPRSGIRSLSPLSLSLSSSSQFFEEGNGIDGETGMEKGNSPGPSGPLVLQASAPAASSMHTPVERSSSLCFAEIAPVAEGTHSSQKITSKDSSVVFEQHECVDVSSSHMGNLVLASSPPSSGGSAHAAHPVVNTKAAPSVKSLSDAGGRSRPPSPKHSRIGTPVGKRSGVASEVGEPEGLKNNLAVPVVNEQTNPAKDQTGEQRCTPPDATRSYRRRGVISCSSPRQRGRTLSRPSMATGVGLSDRSTGRSVSVNTEDFRRIGRDRHGRCEDPMIPLDYKEILEQCRADARALLLRKGVITSSKEGSGGRHGSPRGFSADYRPAHSRSDGPVSRDRSAFTSPTSRGNMPVGHGYGIDGGRHSRSSSRLKQRFGSLPHPVNYDVYDSRLRPHASSSARRRQLSVVENSDSGCGEESPMRHPSHDSCSRRGSRRSVYSARDGTSRFATRLGTAAYASNSRSHSRGRHEDGDNILENGYGSSHTDNRASSAASGDNLVVPSSARRRRISSPETSIHRDSVADSHVAHDELTEEELLREVEYKLVALRQQMELEDDILEERMLKSPWERLYHLNNRRDRDERRWKVMQYNTLQSVRDKIVCGTIDREVAEREKRLQAEQTLLTDPESVFLRLYNGAASARGGASGASSRRTTPRRRPNDGASSLINLSRDDGDTATRGRSKEAMDAAFSRLYEDGAEIMRSKQERFQRAQAKKLQDEEDVLLMSRLAARVVKDFRGKLLTAEEVDHRVEQLQRKVKQHPAQYKNLVKSPKISPRKERELAWRLWKSGYVSGKTLRERKVKQELKECTFTPQVNAYSPRSGRPTLHHRLGDGDIADDAIASNAGKTVPIASAGESRCAQLYNKAVKSQERRVVLQQQHDREMRLRVLKGRMECDHHFRRRVELDPSLAERYMKSLVV